MTNTVKTTAHSAADAALGFWYQSLYALLALWREQDDDATVLVEQLDDVTLVSNGEVLLEQLKHSLSAKPASLSIKSVSLWKTLKAWIDILPSIELSHTRFNLITVADVQENSELKVLLNDDEDRSTLLSELEDEALRVKDEREKAKIEKKTNFPHATRAPGCEAFLLLDKELRKKLLGRIRLKPKHVNVANIEDELAKHLTGVTADRRAFVAKELVEWWDRQVLYSMCGKRPPAISRFELIKRHMEIISDIELDSLPNPFATESPPSSHQPDNMIQQQIELVGGSEGQLERAIREEWRARETRSLWSIENPSRYDLIVKYDDRLTEEWSDRHVEIIEDCDGESEETKKQKGRELLTWSHKEAPAALEPIAPEVVSPYYIRGSYQVLSTTGVVGWHPQYRKLLGFKE